MLGCQPSEDRTPEQESVIVNGIRWVGNSEAANIMAKNGLNRYITYENSHAFIMSEGAVNVDSSLFASHTILAFLSTGDRKEHHKRMAERFVENENETSKLFVSLLNFDEKNDSSRAERRNIWTKMHESSNDPFIHYMYIRFMEGDHSKLVLELDKLIAFCEESQFDYVNTAANNMKGYILKRTGDLQAGTTSIKKCLELHPDGYNPLDSRAEFYLYAGDTANAIKTYHKVLEKYPYASYATDQLANLELELLQ